MGNCPLIIHLGEYWSTVSHQGKKVILGQCLRTYISETKVENWVRMQSHRGFQGPRNWSSHPCAALIEKGRKSGKKTN